MSLIRSFTHAANLCMCVARGLWEVNWVKEISSSVMLCYQRRGKICHGALQYTESYQLSTPTAIFVQHVLRPTERTSIERGAGAFSELERARKQLPVHKLFPRIAPIK